MSELTLNGGISYYKYVWVSNGGCDACEELDGQEFEDIGDIPDRPHPNCCCSIEIVEQNEGGDNEEGELCDCWEEIDSGLGELDAVAGEVESEKDETEAAVEDVENSMQKVDNLISEIQNEQAKNKNEEPYVLKGSVAFNTYRSLTSIYQSIMQEMQIAILAYEIFQNNKEIMDSIDWFNGKDKYFHAKSNCETARLGEFGVKMAELLSEAKEVKDILYKVIILKQDFDATLEDCMQDLMADRYGREKCGGEESCEEKVIDIIKIFKKKTD